MRRQMISVRPEKFSRRVIFLVPKAYFSLISRFFAGVWRVDGDDVKSLIANRFEEGSLAYIDMRETVSVCVEPGIIDCFRIEIDRNDSCSTHQSGFNCNNT